MAKHRVRFKWGRLLVNPTTRVEAQDRELTTLRVDGLFCSDVCAVRTRQALERLDGVERVSVDFEAGVATIVGQPHEAATYERALTGAVAGRGVRRLIERLAMAIRRH
ncbi:MAG: cation transporter [Chloroflexi bacterium]|nr:cation transporter [Chloroflexota bacterium]